MVKTKHMFLLSKIVDKMGIDEQVQEVMKELGGKKKVNETVLGSRLMIAVGKRLHLAEAEVTSLLADTSGKTKKEIEDQPLKQTFKMVQDLLSEEGVLSFLQDQLEVDKK